MGRRVLVQLTTLGVGQLLRQRFNQDGKQSSNWSVSRFFYPLHRKGVRRLVVEVVQEDYRSSKGRLGVVLDLEHNFQLCFGDTTEVNK